jgi:catechol 2,3-dioxygenase-like lactoylglutathione lyase family enzyme
VTTTEVPPSLAFDHVQIAAPPGAEAAARAFFGELLGLPEIPKPAVLAVRGGVWFQCGPHQIHVGIEADFRPARKAHLALRVADPATLASLRARLEHAGVTTRDGEAAEGVVRFFADDPWGNRMEFLAPAG